MAEAKGWTYYNEIDPYCVQWLRNLIKAGHLPDGEVDDRPIQRVWHEDLKGFTQCHFFAGIGGRPLALHMAGWPEDQEVWTGSCPCQPFSIAGRRRGEEDERHLWPEFKRIISGGRPSVCFGEQVTGQDGREWISRVHVDLESMGYSFGAANLCAASASAPHCRQRYYFVADSVGEWVRGQECRMPDLSQRRMQAKNKERERFRTNAWAAGMSPAEFSYANSTKQFWWSGPIEVGRSAIQGKATRGGGQQDAVLATPSSPKSQPSS